MMVCMVMSFRNPLLDTYKISQMGHCKLRFFRAKYVSIWHDHNRHANIFVFLLLEYFSMHNLTTDILVLQSRMNVQYISNLSTTTSLIYEYLDTICNYNMLCR
jgi:hypothetical protein